jgi:hypothetical protein
MMLEIGFSWPREPMMHQRTKPAIPQAPEEARDDPNAERAMLHEIARKDGIPLRREPEPPRPIEVTSVPLPEGSSKIESSANLLVQRIAALSLDQLENVISDLQDLRAFLQSEGERVQQEISSYLKLSHTAIGQRRSSQTASRVGKALRRIRPAERPIGESLAVALLCKPRRISRGAFSSGDVPRNPPRSEVLLEADLGADRERHTELP